MIVVNGGAGYVGSVVVEKLLNDGYSVSIIDDLSTGNEYAVPDAVDFYEADITNIEAIKSISRNSSVSTVMHFAARALVGESMRNPQKYWSDNVVKSIKSFDHWIDHGVNNFIFSSTAAVYGEPEYLPIDETHRLDPCNPYGRTKLACEWYLQDRYRADQVHSISLRYFNAAGAGNTVGEDHNPETHLIPSVLNAITDPDFTFEIYGTNYSTRDGTCVRDFVHVDDLARAHIKALERIGTVECKSINLGTAQGSTVREVVNTIKSVTDRDFPVSESAPRPGDPGKLVASFDRANEILDWSPKFGLDEIIRDAWAWKQSKNIK